MSFRNSAVHVAMVAASLGTARFAAQRRPVAGHHAAQGTALRHLRRRAAVRRARSQDPRDGRLRRRPVQGDRQALGRDRQDHAAVGRGPRARGEAGTRRHHGRQSRLHARPRRADPVQRSLLPRQGNAGRQGERPRHQEGRLQGQAPGFDQGLDVGAVDQAERLGAAHLPGHRLGLHGRAAEQGASAWSPTR